MAAIFARLIDSKPHTFCKVHSTFRTRLGRKPAANQLPFLQLVVKCSCVEVFPMRVIIMASRFEIFLKKSGLDARLKSSRLLGVFSAGIIFLSAGLLQAQLIDVDFNYNGFGSLGPTMSGAAVLGAAGDQWNGINVAGGSGISLIYVNGSSSPVKMTFTSGGGYYANGASPFASTSYSALMQDYLYTTSGAKTITLSGLATNSTYNLVLYNAADNAAAGRTTSFTINLAFSNIGISQSSTWNATSSTLISGVDYVQFTSALSDGSGNLVFSYSPGAGSSEGDIEGFQIQLIPSVTITNPPVSFSSFTAPANVNIAASATISGGTVTNVQFFNNGISLGSDQTAPFSITASNLAIGTYSFTAVATAAGISATSSVVSVSVVSPPTPTVTITNPVNGVVFAAPANVNIAADAEVSSGTVNSVQFFANGASLGTVLTYPFSLTASNLTVGAYSLTAVVTAAGISATSSVVSVSVGGQLAQANNAAYTWTTFAGTTGTGTADGTGSNARFNNPSGVVSDTNGNAYVLDSGNNTIRKVTRAGVSSTIAGFAGTSGTNDGVGSNARFNSPTSIAMDHAGNLYVADTYNNTIRKMTPVGTNWVVSTIAGQTQNNQFTFNPNPGSADGTNSAAQFYGLLASQWTVLAIST
jgi:hypothetical protein